jgi:hypothetical protein
VTANNNRTNGWDERDYRLWSALGELPSYGRIDQTDHLVSLKQVEDLLRKHAEIRYDKTKMSEMQGDKGHSCNSR